MDDDEEGAFQPEEVKAIIEKVCNTLLAGQAFQHAKVEQWSQLIVENVLKDVAANNDDAAKTVNGKFKYIVTCHIQQKTGAALNTSTTCYWDKATDGFTSYKWESNDKEVPDGVQVLCTVYGAVV